MVFNVSVNENPDSADRNIRVELTGDWNPKEIHLAKGMVNILAASTLSREPSYVSYVATLMIQVGFKLHEKVRESL